MNSHSLKFTNLVGMLDDRDFRKCFDAHSQQLISFDDLHVYATKTAKELAAELNTTYDSQVIIDYGDEPHITGYYEGVYMRILSQVERHYPEIRTKMRELFDKTCRVTEHTIDPKIDSETKINEVTLCVQETKDLLVFFLMNAEIMQAIYKLHYQRFGRPFFKQLWDFASAKSENFKDYVLRGVLIGTQKHLEFLTKSMQEQFLLEYGIEPEDEQSKQQEFKQLERQGYILVKGSTSSVKQPEVRLILDKIGEIQRQLRINENIIKTHHTLLNSMIDRLPVRYTDDNFYLQSFQSYMANPHSLVNKQHYLKRLYEAPMVLDVSAPEEAPVYNYTDLILVLGHTFIANTNSYGLSISAYLYTTALNIDPSISGAIQAAVPFGSFLFGFLWNYLTGFNRYKWPYMLSIALGIISNFLYYIAATTVRQNDPKANVEGIVILVIGRLLMGVSGARLMTRKYVATSIKSWAQTKYSSIFVAVSFSAICIGPGIQAVIFFKDFGPTNCESFSGTNMCNYNMYAFIYIFVWIAVGVLYLLFFTGYDKKKEARELRNRFDPVEIFSSLNRLDMKSAVEKQQHKPNRKMTIADILAKRERGHQPGTHLSESILNNSLANSHKNVSQKPPSADHSYVELDQRDIFADRVNDPFMALIEKHEFELISKNISASKDLHREKDIIERKSKLNQSHNARRMSMDVSFSTFFRDWRSNIKYVIYRPAAYTIYAAFLLFVCKVN